MPCVASLIAWPRRNRCRAEEALPPWQAPSAQHWDRWRSALQRKRRIICNTRDRFTDALDRLGPYSSSLLELVDADADAYNLVLAAYKLPKGSPERDEAIQNGLIRATEIPSRIGTCAAEALEGSGGTARADSHQCRIRPPGRNADAAVLVCGAQSPICGRT